MSVPEQEKQTSTLHKRIIQSVALDVVCDELAQVGDTPDPVFRATGNICEILTEELIKRIRSEFSQYLYFLDIFALSIMTRYKTYLKDLLERNGIYMYWPIFKVQMAYGMHVSPLIGVKSTTRLMQLHEYMLHHLLKSSRN